MARRPVRMSSVDAKRCLSRFDSLVGIARLHGGSRGPFSPRPPAARHFDKLLVIELNKPEEEDNHLVEGPNLAQAGPFAELESETLHPILPLLPPAPGRSCRIRHDREKRFCKRARLHEREAVPRGV